MLFWVTSEREFAVLYSKFSNSEPFFFPCLLVFESMAYVLYFMITFYYKVNTSICLWCSRVGTI